MNHKFFLIEACPFIAIPLSTKFYHKGENSKRRENKMTPYGQLVKQIEESFKYSNADAEEYAKKLKDMALEEYRKELEADDK